MSNQLHGFDNAVFNGEQEDGQALKQTSDKEIQSNETDDQKPSHLFGWGSFGTGLQCCNKMALFVAYTFILCFLEGIAINGIANAALPSIEKQFNLSSTKSALIPSAQDIGALSVVLFVSFIGSRYHKPRLIAAGSVIMAMGSLLFMVPHFVEEYTYTESSAESSSSRLCNGSASSTEDESSTCESGDSKYLSVFVLAQAVHGIGFSPMFTLGTVYIDENEAHNLASLYIGLTFAAAACGVATGFFIGGQFIAKLFVDFDRKSVDFDSSDPRWVGAWWFGFIITSIGFLLVAIPISGFPKALPNTEKYKPDQNVHVEKEKEFDSIPSRVLFQIKLFIKAFIRLLRNPVYMSQLFAGVCGSLIISGVGSFSFKYLAEQYNLSPDLAGIYIGGLILFGAFGMFLGGLLVRIFNLSLVGMLRLCSLSTFLSAILGIAFLAGCPEVPLVGLEIPYNGGSKIDFKDGCHASCLCDTQSYFPICGSDDKVYYSPCHAGCSSLYETSYGNCSCVAEGFNVSILDPSSSAVSGKCQYDCSNLSVVAPCLFLAMICMLTSVTPSSMSTLRIYPEKTEFVKEMEDEFNFLLSCTWLGRERRLALLPMQSETKICVEKEDKAIAVGIGWVFLRLLGTIPGPVLVGWVLDQSCLLWSSSTCKSASFCQLYSHKDMAMGVMTWWVGVCAVGSIFFFISSCFAMKDKNKYELEEGSHNNY